MRVVEPATGRGNRRELLHRAAGVLEGELAEPAGALDHVQGSYESAQEPSESYFAANWGFRPQPADMQAVRAVQQKRCSSCHADVDLARPDWIDPRKPAASLYLLAPLAKEKHDGWEKCRPAVFRDTDDPDYQTLLAETHKIIGRMREDPTPGMKELLAAEAGMPEKPAVALAD